jgi:hypothetical protein
MTEILWKPDDSFKGATRAETARVGLYELIAMDMPARPPMDRYFWWALYGPPYYTGRIDTGNATSFDDAKAKAIEALERIKNSGPHPE